ncbi:MAG TPA: DUF1707 domain-containing protein [Marmoricola sp.]|jgi:hypothetical protein|nr:DUF1707 domain-containing protein [Marmoricola sp.]
MTVSGGDERAPQPPASPDGLADVGRLLGQAWTARLEQQRSEAADAEALHDSALASDADRDGATRRLAEAFAQGRLTRTELESRTGEALAARTYGDLDQALRGLGLSALGPVQPPHHPVRKVLFWFATVITSPFLLLGTALTVFGDDVDDHVGGIVMLVLFLPGLLALRRWAWPKDSGRTTPAGAGR